jgi:serine/threonine protein kinase
MPLFNPNPNDTLQLLGEEFVVLPHPNAPMMAYGQEGGRATIFKVRDRVGSDFALKVFKPTFVDARQPEVAKRLAPYARIPGLRAADRRVVPPSNGAPRSALEQAVVMPWIQGITWFDVLTQVKARGGHIRVEAAIHLCQRFLGVLRSLEDRGAAHTDIAAGNVVIDPTSLEVELVDLEELFGPDFSTPPALTRRTPGYTRDNLGSSTNGFWRADGDRFAGAVLAAEILALSAPDLGTMSHGDSFFDPETIGLPRAPHYQSVVDYLKRLVPGFSELFMRTWSATALCECATIAECASSIEALAVHTAIPAGDFFALPRPRSPERPTPSAIPQPEFDDEEARAAAIRWTPLPGWQPPKALPPLVPPHAPPRATFDGRVPFYALLVIVLVIILASVVAANVR